MRPAAALAPLVVLLAAVTGVALYALSRPVEPPRKVKLAVLVVFDQMRGDYLQQWQPLFCDDGFARLQRDGAWFTNCHYPYATTTTGPGHASMLTGAAAEKHGIINNDWNENGAGVYCAGHERYQLVPPVPKFPPDPNDKKPTKKDTKLPSVGTPERLLSETVADVLKEATNGRAKVFGLSLKDRSAILPTGKRPDGAYWFYGLFGTSNYYADKVHPWVEEFNRSGRATRWFGQDWTQLRPDLDYNAWSGPDNAGGEGKGVGQGVTFPHPMTGGKPKLGRQYYEALANSPFGNTLLLEFTKACVLAEKLGTDDVPDLLVVSFSSNDLVGHTWGPDSHEVLDVTLRSDVLMADLLAFLDRTVGKDQYLVGVTADHGICPLPEVARTKGVAPFAARVDPKDLEADINEHLTKMFPASKPADGKAAKWVEAFVFPWVYLKPELAKAVGQPREAIAAEAARFLATRNGVARTFTYTELNGPVSDTDELAVRTKRSFHPARSGDVCVILQPYSIPSAKLGSTGVEAPTGTTHGAPYAYDTHVPLLVYGPGIRGGPRDEPTTPQALASIFAKWLDIRRPKDVSFPIPETLE
jgi:predicted AlkP superfamily pyrophosphatase or phosphodiesterase